MTDGRTKGNRMKGMKRINRMNRMLTDHFFLRA